MSFLRLTHVLTVVVTSSYLTLALFAFGDAKRLLIPYAVIAALLALINLWSERHAER